MRQPALLYHHPDSDASARGTLRLPLDHGDGAEGGRRPPVCRQERRLPRCDYAGRPVLRVGPPAVRRTRRLLFTAAEGRFSRRADGPLPRSAGRHGRREAVFYPDSGRVHTAAQNAAQRALRRVRRSRGQDAAGRRPRRSGAGTGYSRRKARHRGIRQPYEKNDKYKS